MDRLASLQNAFSRGDPPAEQLGRFRMLSVLQSSALALLWDVALSRKIIPDALHS